MKKKQTVDLTFSVRPLHPNETERRWLRDEQIKIIKENPTWENFEAVVFSWFPTLYLDEKMEYYVKSHNILGGYAWYDIYESGIIDLQEAVSSNIKLFNELQPISEEQAELYYKIASQALGRRGSSHSAWGISCLFEAAMLRNDVAMTAKVTRLFLDHIAVLLEIPYSERGWYKLGVDGYDKRSVGALYYFILERLRDFSSEPQ